MQSTSITKACVVPICNNKKFNLVHKFPADKERFNEWMGAIQKNKPIQKLSGLTPDAIRKRYFVCSRHFSPKEYKNIESRSLNLTAVPFLNFNNLDEIHLSKAKQLEENPDVSSQENHQEAVKCKPSVLKVPPANPPAIRILNSEASKSVNSGFDTHLEAQFTPCSDNDTHIECSPNLVESLLAEAKQEPIELVDDSAVAEPPLKRIKTKSPKSARTNRPRLNAFVPCDSAPKPQKVQLKVAKSPPSIKINEIVQNMNVEQPAASDNDTTAASKPTNKLLALLEVTPEQYDRLSKSLSSAERNENVNCLLNFFDNDENDPADNEVIVELEDGTSLSLDLFWLRDHCRCQSCYDHSNHQRKINILDIPDDIDIEKHELKQETLHVTWDDGHESKYELKFLIQNQPNKLSVSTELTLWNKESIEVPTKTNCRVSMRDYMSDPEVSKKVLESLHVYGVAFIDGVQPTQQNTEFVIRQLFPVHKTLFGEMWTFSDAKKDHSDTAYTNIYLGPHNDNTYFNDAAGLQILHCITYSGTGGENFLIDGFYVAHKIKQEHPEVFKRLTTTIITGEYIEDGHHHKHSSPIISLDPVTGEVSQIRFNLYDRAPFKTVAAGKIRQFYSDLKVLTREFENIDNRIVFKLQPGTVMIFDNWRVLHGRLAYAGKRTMTGCYVARTEFQSALRVNGFIE